VKEETWPRGALALRKQTARLAHRWPSIELAHPPKSLSSSTISERMFSPDRGNLAYFLVECVFSQRTKRARRKLFTIGYYCVAIVITFPPGQKEPRSHFNGTCDTANFEGD
jgi:hypothetical protein